MKNYHKHTTQLEVYELLDRVIATSDEATFYAQLKHLLDRRKEEGFIFNDHKRFVLPPRRAWRRMMRDVKKLAKRGE
jgi:hypothetical protein